MSDMEIRERRPNGYNTRWTPNLEEELKSLQLSGFSARVMAERFGVTRNSIIGKLNRLGLSAAEVAHPWKPEEEEYLTSRWREAERIEQIAEELTSKFGTPRTAKSVSCKAKALGLYSRRTRHPARPSSKRVYSAKAAVLQFKKRQLPDGFEPLNIPFLQAVDGQCRDVVGRGEDGLVVFCGHPVVLNHDCAAHRMINRMTMC
jgi:hypothetical protein